MGESTILLAAWRVLALFALFFHGYLLGKTVFPSQKRIASFPIGLVLTLAIQSLFQTVWYYVGGSLGWISDVVTLVLSVALIQSFLFSRRRSLTTPVIPAEAGIQPRQFMQTTVSVAFLTGALAAFIFILHGASVGATVESIRTPWPLLPALTLLAIAALWLTLILSAIVCRRAWFLFFHSAFAIGATTAIAPILYRIGFGFDGFLHVASEEILLRTGTLSPKPLYYIGQYVFTTWLSRFTDLPLASIDRWLVPAFAAMLIPLVICLVLRAEKPADRSVVLILAFLPLAPFVATTPQSFAFILSLAAIVLAGAGLKPAPTFFLPALLLSFWAVAVHPLAGIPVVLIVLALSLRRRVISWSLIVLAAASVPLLFVLIGGHGTTEIAWNFSSLTNPSLWLNRLSSFTPWIGNHFVLWPAWASLAEKSVPLLLLALSLIALKRTDKENRTNAVPLLIGAAILLWIAATILGATGDFAFLIDYERGNYADRLNTLALFCLIPSAMVGIRILVDRIRVAPIHIKAASVAALVLFATGLAYDALPRNDALVIGHGWSVSANDIDAVKYIDHAASGRAYTVLADQSVSAAAVRTFGFKRYAKDNVFFYPIPTGGPLYQLFLDMTYKEPSRETAHDAAVLGQSDLVFVVVNDYWWKANALAETLSTVADNAWDVGDGRVRVYTFDFKK